MMVKFAKPIWKILLCATLFAAFMFSFSACREGKEADLVKIQFADANCKIYEDPVSVPPITYYYENGKTAVASPDDFWFEPIESDGYARDVTYVSDGKIYLTHEADTRFLMQFKVYPQDAALQHFFTFLNVEKIQTDLVSLRLETENGGTNPSCQAGHSLQLNVVTAPLNSSFKKGTFSLKWDDADITEKDIYISTAGLLYVGSKVKAGTVIAVTVTVIAQKDGDGNAKVYTSPEVRVLVVERDYA
jgi:hypothetical protein